MLQPEQIIHERCKALRQIRYLTVILLAIGLGVAACWLAFELADEIEYWDGIDYVFGLCVTAAVLVPGFLLLALQRPISRWLVPKPRDECYECRYLLKGLSPERCPECGTILRTVTHAEASAAGEKHE